MLVFGFVLTDGLGEQSGIALWNAPLPPPSPLRITNIATDSGGFTINWSTDSLDPRVDIYRSADLRDWIGPISTENAVGSFTDSPLPGPKAFYTILPYGTLSP
jgi:hypothetical protein